VEKVVAFSEQRENSLILFIIYLTMRVTKMTFALGLSMSLAAILGILPISMVSAAPTTAAARPAPFLYWPLPDNQRTIVNYPDSPWSQALGMPRYAGHHGTDVGGASGLPIGTPVYAAANGVVTFAYEACTDGPQLGAPGNTCPNGSGGFNQGTHNWGNQVWIKHTVNGREWYTVYAHLKNNSVTVSQGQTVIAGDQLAASGNTGASTGGHLHFELQNTNPINYTGWDDPWGSSDAPHTNPDNKQLWVRDNTGKPMTAVNAPRKAVVLPNVPCLKTGECAVYRFYDNTQQNHLFTTSISEKATVESQNGWIAEGLAFNVFASQKTGTVPVYRLRRTSNNEHFLTANTTEKNNAIASGSYTYEGIAFYTYAAAATGRLAVYRFWNASTSSHFYTTSTVERDALRLATSGWTYEGVKFYAKAVNTCSGNVCPVFRMYHQTQGRHFMTRDYNEAKTALNADRNWQYEAVVFYAYKAAPSTAYKPVYRLRRNANGSYLYTTSVAERDSLKNSGAWTYEAIAFYAFNTTATTRVPVYRFYNASVPTHLYSANSAEIASISSNPSWTNEGVKFYAQSTF
jgi:hypothetical protein